ncbi:MAG: DUF4266 domain-containing protein [Steroidobacteraceae bacterium]|jgi:hypothetical protein|nr:DUF4266 domain-containing protein [Steroidobacteraceae bacterium]
MNGTRLEFGLRARHLAARTLAVGAVLSASVLLAACGRVEPWVKPYERERLADPIMAWDRAAISSSYLGHVRENREGAKGGTGAGGGGCGCN